MPAAVLVSYVAALLLACLAAYCAGWLVGSAWRWITRKERERLGRLFDKTYRRR